MKINLILGAALPMPPVRGGGIEIFAYGLAKELAKKHEVTIYSRKFKDQPNYERKGNLEFIRVWGFDKTKNKLAEYIKLLIHEFALNMKIQDADINHFFSLESFVWSLLWNRRAKSILELQCTLKGPYIKFGNKADRIVVLSDYMRNFFVKQVKLDGKKIEVIPNAVDVELFQKKVSLKPFVNKYHLTGMSVILYVGRLSPEKGVDYLIKSFCQVKKKIKKVKLIIVGPTTTSEFSDESYYKKLQRIIAENELERDVIFTGAVKHDLLPGYLALANVVVFPQVWDEPFGIVYIEAMAAGKAMVATKSGALPEIIEDGKTGYIVPKRDEKVLAKKIISVLENRDLREGLEANSRGEAQRYSFKKIVRNYESLYGDVIRNE